MIIEIKKLKEIAQKYGMFLYEEPTRITLLVRSNIFDSTIWNYVLDGKGHLNSLCYFKKSLECTFVELKSKETYLIRAEDEKRFYFSSTKEFGKDFEIVLKTNITNVKSLCTYLQEVKDSIKKAVYYLKKEEIKEKKKLIENDFK